MRTIQNLRDQNKVLRGNSYFKYSTCILICWIIAYIREYGMTTSSQPETIRVSQNMEFKSCNKLSLQSQKGMEEQMNKKNWKNTETWTSAQASTADWGNTEEWMSTEKQVSLQGRKLLSLSDLVSTFHCRTLYRIQSQCPHSISGHVRTT